MVEPYEITILPEVGSYERLVADLEALTPEQRALPFEFSRDDTPGIQIIKSSPAL